MTGGRKNIAKDNKQMRAMSSRGILSGFTPYYDAEQSAWWLVGEGEERKPKSRHRNYWDWLAVLDLTSEVFVLFFFSLRHVNYLLGSFAFPPPRLLPPSSVCVLLMS